MLVLHKFRAYVGLLLCFIAGACPMLKVPFKGNWNLYQVDNRLFFITYGILALCTLFMFIRKVAVYRFTVRLFLIWFLLAVGAVYFKVNNYFNFKFVDNLLSKTIHFQWGWMVLFLGILFLLFSTSKLKANKSEGINS